MEIRTKAVSPRTKGQTKVSAATRVAMGIITFIGPVIDGQ
jgi:hypothetical protein